MTSCIVLPVYLCVYVHNKILESLPQILVTLLLLFTWSIPECRVITYMCIVCTCESCFGFILRDFQVREFCIFIQNEVLVSISTRSSIVSSLSHDLAWTRQSLVTTGLISFVIITFFLNIFVMCAIFDRHN